ncbi:MAG: hypothetical protein LKM41_08420 [Lachnospiraceae bacterium]|jgi:hypothetical protein|nr:hypothetical protein [Lachnospiraceae bacterium]
MEQNELIEKLTNNTEFVKKAASCKDAASLAALAKESGVEIPGDLAEKILGMLNPDDGELNIDELKSVSGGKC